LEGVAGRKYEEKQSGELEGVGVLMFGE